MSEARQRILTRLRGNRPAAEPPQPSYQKTLGWDREQRIASFIERMQAVRGEVHRLNGADWVAWLVEHLPARGQRRALIGHSAIAERFCAEGGADAFDVRRYEQPIERWKSDLFGKVDFSVTGARAGLAETGSLVLWPDATEPRLMSLAPPLHVVVLDTDRLYENFADLIAREHWHRGMPTNALLISGPSKTADIEQTLAFGIHGPKQLITLLLD